MHTTDQIPSMTDFLVDNIFVRFGTCIFHQVIGIPMRMNCAPLFADLFLCWYETKFQTRWSGVVIRELVGHLSFGTGIQMT